MSKKKSGELKDWALLTSAFFNVLQLSKQAKTKGELELTKGELELIKAHLNHIIGRLKEWQKAFYKIKEENNCLRKMLDELELKLSQYKNKIYLIELEKAKLKKEDTELRLKEESNK